MNSEKDQDIFIQNQKGCTNVQHFCLHATSTFCCSLREVVGNHHSQSTLEKIFWPLPGSLSSSVSQFGSQNWIVRVGKYLWVSFFVGWLCPQGERDFEYLGNWDTILASTASQSATDNWKPSSCPFPYIFASNSSWVIPYHVYIVSS
jgi:hypothetical protein